MLFVPRLLTLISVSCEEDSSAGDMSAEELSLTSAEELSLISDAELSLALSNDATTELSEASDDELLVPHATIVKIMAETSV